MNSTTTRRNLLRIGTTAAAYAAGASIVTGGVALASQAKGAEPQRAEWDRLRAAYHAAYAEEDRARRVEDHQEGVWFEQREQAEPRPTKPEPEPFDNSMSLAAILERTKCPDWKARYAAYERADAEWQARREADKAVVMGDAEKKCRAASDACDKAFGKVRGYHVTSLAMLAEKVEILNERYVGDYEGHDAELLVEDIKRLAAQEAR